MMISNILSYLLISCSLSFMWNFAEIFIPIRNLIAKIPYLRKPFLCPECSSFWIGLFFSFLYNPLINQFKYISYILCGSITHIICAYIFLLFLKLKKD